MFLYLSLLKMLKAKEALARAAKRPLCMRGAGSRGE
jgi:hypothetical protein